MKRMVTASTIAAVVAIVTAFSPGPGVASPNVPAGLAAAIHAPPALFGSQVSLSADGTTALVSAPAVGAYTGAAYIFHVSSAGAWATSSTPAATLTYRKGIFIDLIGENVALSADGTTAFVAARL